MNPQAALPTRPLAPGAALMQAKALINTPATLDSPALAVMTDLSQIRAATTGPRTSLAQAEQIMIYQGVRMLFVVSDMPSLEGLITTTDLHGDRQMRIVHERKLRYDELCVADVMTPLASLDAIELDAMKKASVRNLIATLKQLGRNHLLVVEADAAVERVRGIVSRAQIERQTGLTIEITEVASSFADIERLLS